MTDTNDPEIPRKIVVPGRGGTSEPEEFEGLVSGADIGSASRSCLAIIVILIVIALLLCVFLLGSIVR